jgi:hypothetical protein
MEGNIELASGTLQSLRLQIRVMCALHGSGKQQGQPFWLGDVSFIFK